MQLIPIMSHVTPTFFQSALTYDTNKFVEEHNYGKMLGVNLVFINHLGLPVLLMCRGW